MPKGVIILRWKDKELPEQFLDRVLEHNKSAVGAAFADRGELLMSSVANTTVDKIKKTARETDTSFKEYPLLFSFFNHTSTLPDEDKQPYVLLRNDKDEPILAAFLEGDFSNLAQAGSSHSDEYDAVQELLIPKFQKMWKEAGNKVENLMGMMQDKLIKREMQTLFLSDGSITLIANSGEIVTFAKGESNREFPWGWTTNSYGYEQPTKKDIEKPKEDTAKSKLDAIKAKLAAAAADEDEDEEDEADKEAEAAEGAVATDVAAKSEAAPKPPKISDSDYEVVMMAPPKSDSGNRKKKWYRKNYGSVPSNWADCPQVPVRRLRAKGEAPPEVAKAVEAKTDTAIPIEALKPKDTSVQHIPSATADAKSEQVTDEVLPVIPPREKKWVSDTFLAEAIDETSKEIVDPKEYQAFEEKYPTFAQAFNFESLKHMNGVSFENLLKLVKEAPTAAAVLIFNYRTAYMTYMAEKAKQTPPKPAEEGLDLRSRRRM